MIEGLIFRKIELKMINSLNRDPFPQKHLAYLKMLLQINGLDLSKRNTTNVKASFTRAKVDRI